MSTMRFPSNGEGDADRDASKTLTNRAQPARKVSHRMPEHSNDIEVFTAILEDRIDTAAVHRRTACVDDLFHVRQADLPATSIDSWNRYYRPPLEKDGLVSEADFKSRFLPDTSTLDSFILSNMTSVPIDCQRLHLVDTESSR